MRIKKKLKEKNKTKLISVSPEGIRLRSITRGEIAPFGFGILYLPPVFLVPFRLFCVFPAGILLVFSFADIFQGRLSPLEAFRTRKGKNNEWTTRKSPENKRKFNLQLHRKSESKIEQVVKRNRIKLG